MAFEKLNERSIRLFAATPEELEKKRPNLNSPYFRVSRASIEKLLAMTNGDVIMSLGVWKRKGQEGKPDYFTAELTYPDAEGQAKYLKKDDEWKAANPRSAGDQAARRKYAMNRAAERRLGTEEAPDIPF